MSTAVFGAPGWRASSGRKITPGEDGSVSFEGGYGYVGPNRSMDAEEFYQAKKDAELGRWRVPTQPDIVVYPVGDGNKVRVFSEKKCYLSRVITRDEATTEFAPTSAMGNAHAYFEAHPERKPWECAEDGQMWLLRFDDFPATDVSALVKEGRFVYNDRCHDGVTERTDTTIVDGRCIWPVDETAPVELHAASSQAGLSSIRGGL